MSQVPVLSEHAASHDRRRPHGAILPTDRQHGPKGHGPVGTHRATYRRWSPASTAAMFIGFGLGALVYVVFGLVPTLANIVISLTNYTSLHGVPVQFTGLANYVALGTTQLPGFVDSLIATVLFVVGVTVVQNAIGLALAHRLQGTSRTAGILRVLVFLPIVLGVTVIALVWLLIFDPSGGPGAALFEAFGIRSAFFGSQQLALPLVIGVQVWQNLGFTMLLFIGGLKSIPVSVYEAGALDGVSAWQRFALITWPLMAPSVTVNVLFAVVGSFTTYNLIYVLTAGANGTNTLGLAAFTSAFGQSADLGLGAALTTVLFILTTVLALPLAAVLRHREARILGSAAA